VLITQLQAGPSYLKSTSWGRQESPGSVLQFAVQSDHSLRHPPHSGTSSLVSQLLLLRIVEMMAFGGGESTLGTSDLFFTNEASGYRTLSLAYQFVIQ
jgi:hypothetical protein